jgi:pyridinium-3,5-bisthiocarboxylic acid mononucleotide nickel chelatase
VRLHLDCRRGINAVSALASLVDSGIDVAAIAEQLHGLPSRVDLGASTSAFDGETVTVVEIGTELADQTGLDGVLTLIDAAGLTPRSASIAIGVYERLTRAEASVHGTTVEEVTFHEVGAARSIVAVLGLAVAIDLLDPAAVTASDIVVGSGAVDTAHGRLDVPTPATRALLRNTPWASTTLRGEVVTPTGAAILTQLADRFEPMSSDVDRVGSGADLQRHPPIVTRALLSAPTT